MIDFFENHDKAKIKKYTLFFSVTFILILTIFAARFIYLYTVDRATISSRYMPPKPSEEQLYLNQDEIGLKDENKQVADNANSSGGGVTMIDDSKIEEVICNGKKINLEYDYYNGRTRIVFKKDNKVVGDENFSNYYEVNAEIFKQAECDLYIGISIAGRGGYILYGGPVALYKLRLNENSIAKIIGIDIKTNDGAVLVNNFITDMSKDEASFVMIANSGDDDKKIKILNRDGKVKKTFDVKLKYNQFGDAKLSEDGKKLVYGAAIGDPNAEKGDIYIINVENGKQSLYKQSDGFFIINGWKNNEEPEYELIKY